jgi:hypothetical protein
MQAPLVLPDDDERAAAVRKYIHDGSRSGRWNSTKSTADRLPKKDAPPVRQAMTPDQLAAHYQTHNLGFKPKSAQCYGTDERNVTDGATFSRRRR